MLDLIVIGKLIFQMNATPEYKTKLQSCVSYGINVSDNIDLYKRLEKCKKKLKSRKRELHARRQLGN